MSSNRLAIQIKAGTENNLVGFPYLEDQYADGGQEDESDDTTEWIFVELGNQKDTTSAQEEFLNTNSNVLYYSIL
jgi:hypothetical protein